MLATGAASTDIGQARERNEDAVLADDELGLYAVSDGVGGHAAGEVASSTTLEILAREVSRERSRLDAVRRGDTEDEGDLLDILIRAVEVAASELYGAALSKPGLAGMACTLTAVLVGRERFAMAHVGDSRLYLVREGLVEQLSVDHTVAEDLHRAGTIDAAKAASSPLAHVLSRALGPQPKVQIDHLLLDAFARDRLLLCTDGLSRYITQPEWLKPRIAGAVEAAAVELVTQANAAGGEDNIGVVLVEIGAGDLDDAAQCEKRKDLDQQLAALRSVFLFQDLTLARLSRVHAACRLRRLQQGQVVIAERDPAEALWVVVRGSLVRSRGGLDLDELGPWDHFGSTTLLAGRPAAATIRADGAACVLELPYAELRGLMRLRPWLGLRILERLGRYLSSPARAAAGAGAGQVGDPRDRI